jgi:hypothetical protein
VPDPDIVVEELVVDLNVDVLVGLKGDQIPMLLVSAG